MNLEKAYCIKLHRLVDRLFCFEKYGVIVLCKKKKAPMK